MLKLQFESNQDYQQKAIASVVDIFEGQTFKNSKFTIVRKSHAQTVGTMIGTGNKLELSIDELHQNVLKIQQRNNLPNSKTIIDDIYKLPNFTIEMETGTGKTYVYTRSILELYNKYGLSKFIIVVPSIAIREGVYKSLEITKEHFESIYPGIQYDFFKYDSSNPAQVVDFAESDSIKIMIINIDAFKKSLADTGKETKANLIHRTSDKLAGEKPIDFIRQSNPIIIIDEPQSVDHTDKAKESILSLNPLFIFRYSATHKEKYNLIYRLGSVDAYEQRLVKKIEVLSVNADGDNNTPYMRLISVDNKSGYKAKLEIDTLDKGISKRKEVIVNTGTRKNLFEISGRKDVYKPFIITSINCTPGYESIEFENGDLIQVGETKGGVDDEKIKRAQIHATIETHLDKEMMYYKKGIKVLSLFFIDRVANYRVYNEDGTTSKGIYAQMFEEEYNKIKNFKKYRTLFDKNVGEYINVEASTLHDGYFSADNKGKMKDSTEKGNADDESTFELIMKDKERLLDINTPLRFIFSHSALKEGWDNPNVFQICTLVETVDTFTKRQKIGRGLRLCVNQDGERVYDNNTNLLTVVANESYSEFAESLQKEMEKEMGVRFGHIEPQIFSEILRFDTELDTLVEIGHEKSEKIYKYLLDKNYIDSKGKISQTLKDDIAKETFTLPQDDIEIQGAIIETIKQYIKTLPIFDGNNKRTVTLKKEVILSSEFVTLWDKIKYQTFYHIDFDNITFIHECINEVKKMEEVKASKVMMEWVGINIQQKGITTSDPRAIRGMILDGYENNLPDIIRLVEENTRLKRSSIVKILTESNRLEEFILNPQVFIEAVIYIINDVKNKNILEGITYEKIGDDYFYTQELFTDKEIIQAFEKNSIPVENSIYDHIIYDSDIEKNFALRLDSNPDIKMFVKLPDSFKIGTPLGNYNPDWAILYDNGEIEKLYFVIETKGSKNENQLRLSESEKIKCAREHFKAVNTGIKYEVVESFEDFMEKV